MSALVALPYSSSTLQMVKCWDLETNKVIRHYHGHLSGVYSLDIHPTLDVLVTAGRDATARVRVDRLLCMMHADQCWTGLGYADKGKHFYASRSHRYSGGCEMPGFGSPGHYREYG